MNTIKVDEISWNLKFVEAITKNKNKRTHEEKVKEMKSLSNEQKDWDKNLKKTRYIV